jgi:hypothetical protein
MRKITIAVIVSTSFISCISVAKLIDFSQTSSTIDFEKLSNEFKQEKKPFWIFETRNEYYFE